MIDHTAEQNRQLHLPRVERRIDGLPYFHYPEAPITVDYNGRKVKMYIPAEQVRGLVNSISEEVNLASAENVVVIQQGGEWFFRQLAALQNFSPEDQRIVRIETKRKPGGKEVDVPNPNLVVGLKERRVAIIEDLVDDGLTAQIMHELTGGTVYALYAKVGFVNQELPSYVSVAATIDKGKWVGGNGSDFGKVAAEKYGYPDNFPRQSPYLAVMPESLTTDNSIF